MPGIGLDVLELVFDILDAAISTRLRKSHVWRRKLIVSNYITAGWRYRLGPELSVDRPP
jgi:hypothetical protein